MLRELKERDHRRGAWIMQNFESTLFIDIICTRLMEAYPAMPILTVHDCLLTVPEHQNALLDVLQTAFAELHCKPKFQPIGYQAANQPNTNTT